MNTFCSCTRRHCYYYLSTTCLQNHVCNCTWHHYVHVITMYLKTYVFDKEQSCHEHTENTTCPCKQTEPMSLKPSMHQSCHIFPKTTTLPLPSPPLSWRHSARHQTPPPCAVQQTYKQYRHTLLFASKLCHHVPLKWNTMHTKHSQTMPNVLYLRSICTLLECSEPEMTHPQRQRSCNGRAHQLRWWRLWHIPLISCTASSYLYFLRVILIFRHSFWHSFWHSFRQIFCILSDILSDKVSDISDILLVCASDSFWHIFWHSFWHIFWHIFWHSFNWHIFWHSFWHIFCHIFWHYFWHIFWHSFWHIFWHSFWHIFWHSFWHIFFPTCQVRVVRF